MNWQGIESAPKDGRVIIVMHEDVGAFAMFWNPAATNEMFCGEQQGMWQTVDGGMTWGDPTAQPSHWAPIEEDDK